VWGKKEKATKGGETTKEEETKEAKAA